MTTYSEQPAAQDLEEEDRILREIEGFEDGISTMALTAQLELKAKVISPIIDRLESENKIHGEKRGLVYYWKPGPDLSKKTMLEDLKAEEPKLEADRPAGSMEKVDKGESSKPPKKMKRKANKKPEGELIPCPIEGCGCQIRKDRRAIYLYLGANKHKLPLVEIHAYLEKMFPKPAGESAEAPATAASSQASGVVMMDCTHSIKEEQAEEPKDEYVGAQPGELAEVPVDHVPAPEVLPEDTPETHPSVMTCELCGTTMVEELEGKMYCPNKDCLLGPGEGAEPAMPDSQPGKEELATGGYVDLKQVAEDLKNMPDCGPQCAIPKAVLVATVPENVNVHAIGNAPVGQDLAKFFRPESEKELKEPLCPVVGKECDDCRAGILTVKDPCPYGAKKDTRPKEISPLEQFAELHERRLRNDIRKMKTAEKRHVRRAIASIRTKTRIEAARRIKERELRRFEEDLATVKGVSP